MSRFQRFPGSPAYVIIAPMATRFNLAAIVGSPEAKVYRRELGAALDPRDAAADME